MQITLPGVLHSINAPSAWYGADAIIDQWHAKVKGLQARRKALF